MQTTPNQLKNTSFHPIVGTKLNSKNTLLLDFTANNPDLATIEIGNTQLFSHYVFGQLEQAGKEFGIGGYLEPRAIYHRSEVFGKPGEKTRNIHLGVDIWAKAGQPVFAPLEGKIHSFQNNEGFGNYGPTIILKHELDGLVFYSLYGHLQYTDLLGIKEGQLIPKGAAFCHIGPYPENGDWPPHLHFQLILDMGELRGDYPGVCAEEELEHYLANCPDPNSFVGWDGE